MKLEKLEGSEMTLADMEAERERQMAAVRADYYAGKIPFMAAVHAVDDIDKAIGKMRDERVRSILNQRRAA